MCLEQRGDYYYYCHAPETKETTAVTMLDIAELSLLLEFNAFIANIDFFYMAYICLFRVHLKA